MIGGEVGQTLAVCFAVHYMRKSYALTVLAAVAFGNLINSILKTYWHEPRPYFLSRDIVPYSCKNFEYGYPSGHAMGFMLVYRTFCNLMTTSHTLKIQVGLFASAIMVSYNRAQQGVHSFDQLIDGFVLALIGSNFLTEPEMLAYMEWLVVNIKRNSLGWVFRQVLCQVFFALEAFYLCLVAVQDHRLSDDKIRTVQYHCKREIDPYEPLHSTFGVNLYSFTLFSSLVALWLIRNDEHKIHSLFNLSDFIDLLKR